MLADKSVTGRSAWGRLFSELTSAITVDVDGGAVSLEEALSRLQSPDREVRRVAAEAVTAGLEPGLRTRAFVFNTLLADKSTDDRLRRYPTLDREPQPRQRGERRVGAGARRRGRGPLRHPAALVRAQGAGCSASTGSPTTTAWRRSRRPRTSSAGTTARELVLDAYALVLTGARRRRAPLLRRGVDRRADAARQAPGRVLRVHRAVAPPVPVAELDRRGAATCSRSRTSSATACTRTWRATRGCSTSRRRSRSPRPRRCSARPSRSGACSPRPSDPAARLALLAESLEGQIATVFRQIAMNRFEDAVHTDRREHGELSSTASASCGPRPRPTCSATRSRSPRATARGGPTSRTSSARPGYVYAYAYGQLLALSVYRQYEEQGAAFVPAYLELLSPRWIGHARGRSAASSASTSPTPAFWDGGLTIIEEQLDAAEDAARAAGRLGGVAPGSLRSSRQLVASWSRPIGPSVERAAWNALRSKSAPRASARVVACTRARPARRPCS